VHGNDLPNLLSIIAILLTLAVIWFARKTVSEAKRTTDEERNAVTELQKIVTALGEVATAQNQAAQLARAQAQEAFLARQHERVLKVGRLVDEMFWAINPYRPGDEVPKHIWMPQRNELRHLLIGLKSPLPSCQKIIDAGTAFQAYESCVSVRTEVEVELQRIDSALEILHAAFRVTLRPADVIATGLGN
jgi:hypothetical protein